MVPSALQFQWLVGWLVGLGLTTAAATVSFGTAAGVTEGYSIKQIKEQYQKGMSNLENFKKSLEEMTKRRKDTIKEIEKKRNILADIENSLSSSHINAKYTIEIKKRWWKCCSNNYFCDALKENLESLTIDCQGYSHKKSF